MLVLGIYCPVHEKTEFFVLHSSGEVEPVLGAMAEDLDQLTAEVEALVDNQTSDEAVKRQFL